MNITQSIEFLTEFDINLTAQQWEQNRNKTVIVGMSGGVDSSVCAILMKLQGYNTIGMFMRNWEEKGEDGTCTSELDYQDVIKVCEQIDIPYYAVNFSQEYREGVFNHFLSEYKKGNTPNPDILCNREIKFKVFFEKAMDFGADFLVTGHYCQNQIKQDRSYLVKGRDTNKDQTYFLYTMQEQVLKKVLFPIGHLEKKQVRELASRFDLATQAKKDSTGICFIGERNFKEFLSQYIQSQQGDFIHLESKRAMGKHDGACYYTCGQRKGLGLGGPGGPWFVADKNIEDNSVYVVEGEHHPALYTDSLIANEVHWITEIPSFPLQCQAKVRYRQADQECVVELNADQELVVSFKQPQRAIAVSQAIVFYQDDICLGGATIKSKSESYFELKKELPVF